MQVAHEERDDDREHAVGERLDAAALDISDAKLRPGHAAGLLMIACGYSPSALTRVSAVSSGEKFC